MAWCTVASAGLHAAAFLVFPAWRPSLRDPETDLRLVSAPTVLIGQLPRGPEGGGAGGGAGQGRGAPSIEAGSGGTAGADGASGEPATPSLAELWDRIARGGSIAPTVVEPEPRAEPESRIAPLGSAEVVDIHERATSTAGLAGVPEPGDVELERFSAVRPELSLMDPSTWVLIRNPGQIDEFMRWRYDLGELDPGEAGVVSVALWIDERGAVRWAEIDQSSGRAALDDVALRLFKDVALFRPARNEGVAVPRSAIFWIRFPWGGGRAEHSSPGR